MGTRTRQLAILLASLSIVVGACGTAGSSATTAPAPASGAASEAPASEAPAAEKVTIRLTTWAGEQESSELQTLVLDEINAAQSEFEIIHEPAPADYLTKVQSSLAAGTGADLIWLSQENIAGYASRGALLDVTDTLAAIDEPAAKVDSYFPDIIKTAVYQDRVYGLPWISQPVLLYYNPAVFDAEGVAYPDDTWDWAKFMEVAESLTKDTDGDGAADQWGFTANGWPPIQMFIWQNGGQVISDDRLTSPLDSPEAIAGAETYANIIYNPACCPSEATIAEQGFNEPFRAGKIAMFIGGAADTFEGLDVVGASVVPHAANDTTFAWTASTVVNAATANPEIATKALVALTEGIHHWKIVAPRPDLANAETISASIPEQWKAQKEGQIDAMIQAAETMRALNVIPRQAEWDDLFWKEFQDPLYHDKGTAAELAAAVRPKLEALLK
jgi:multiple sugar transport system substrate-binding protein